MLTHTNKHVTTILYLTIRTIDYLLLGIFISSSTIFNFVYNNQQNENEIPRNICFSYFSHLLKFALMMCEDKYLQFTYTIK